MRTTALFAALVLGAIGFAPDARGEGSGPSAAQATRATLPTSPASVRGLGSDANVDAFSAQVSHLLPIDLPVGRGGYAPSLALSYSGELGNGSLGVGWRLSYAAIRRSTREGVPAYTDADELELVGFGGGGRLIRIPDGTYRVQGMGNALRVEREVNRFVVTDVDGTRTFLGVSESSREQDDDGRTYQWRPELVVHASGETAEYQYRRDGRRLYLSGISWGPNLTYRAQLEYGTRPDPVESYRPGFRVATALRLETVRVYSQDVELRAYHVGYDDGFGLSRLESIVMTGFEGRDELPTQRFEYAETKAAAVTELSDAEGWTLGARGTTLFDVDGDGMDDLYRLEMGNHEWRKNYGSSFGPRIPVGGATGLDLASTRFIDLDGDARPELVRVVDDTWRYSRMVDGTWVTVGMWPGTESVPLAGAAVEFADVDGDSRIDVLEATTGGVRVRLNSASGLLAPLSRPPINESGARVEIGAANVRVIDANGDGLADIAWLTDEWMKVFLGRGDGTFVPWRRVFYPWPSSALEVGNIHLADLNRDGIVDLVRFSASHALYYEGQPDGSFPGLSRHVARPDGVDADAQVAIADLNGTGSSDIVWSSARGTWVLDLAGATSAGMMARIHNGLGKVVTVEYAPSAQLSAAAALAGNPWQQNLPVSVPVPVALTVDVGDGSPLRRVRHGVRDGFWDGTERAFGGFLVATKTIADENAADVVVETSDFHQGVGAARVLRGSVVRERVHNGLGSVVTDARSVWAAHPIEDLPSDARLRVAVLREVRSAHGEGVAVPIETLVFNEHDGQGRLVATTDLGRLDMEGDEMRLEYTYGADNPDTWVRDRVCVERILNGDGQLEASTRTYYGEATGPRSPLCELGRGLLRETEGWLEEEARWVRLSAAEYNEYSQPLAVVEGPGDAVDQRAARTFEYDPLGLFIVSETVRTDADTTLTWRMEWDTVRGLAYSLTDPAGTITRVTHDDLGRMLTVANGATAPPHMRVSYDWTAPAPKTDVYEFDGDPADLPGSWTGAWDPAGKWRHRVAVTNGAGEPAIHATRLEAGRWILRGAVARDRRGRTTRNYEDSYWSGADPRLAVVDPNTPARTVEFDAFDRVRMVQQANGARQRVVRFAFGQTAITDDLDPVTTRFDGQDRIVRSERTVNGVVESVDATYNAAGRVTSFRLQDGLVEHSFEYDTLGRMVFASDPDVGTRSIIYDDVGRMLEHTNGAGQTLSYSYDRIGRPTSMSGDGVSFAYHYDAGRLIAVDEPTGRVDIGYDSFGRQNAFTRTVDGKVGEERTLQSPSGLLLSVDYRDELVIPLFYDAAGRPTRVGDFWSVDEQDAAGRILSETFGNGVTQVYERDSLGMTSRVTIAKPTLEAVFDVSISRNAFGAIRTVTDSDGVGLDHTAVFGYDGGGRLEDAVLGGAGSEFSFSYGYDGLQNMIERTAVGPRELESFSGVHRYAGARPGGGTYGPRQLTSIAPPGDPDGVALATFDYDEAGRQITVNERSMQYNALDQLTRVGGLGSDRAGVVQHDYGFEGTRVKTVGQAGDARVWFTPAISEANGRRDHYIRLGDRILARVTQQRVEPDADDITPAVSSFGGTLRLGALLCGLLLLAGAAWRWRPTTQWLRPAATASILAVAVAGCSMFGSASQPLWTRAQTVYFHSGVGAGPVVFTRADGSVFAERRYEPFGQSIESYVELETGGSSIGPVDFDRVSYNALNKQTDPGTGWSDHGARWLAPQSARWLTPDPPMKAPKPTFMESPWQLHPYQFVGQNPVAFWDPDGENRKFIGYLYQGVSKSGKVTFTYTGSTIQDLTKRVNKQHHKTKHLHGKTTTVSLKKVYAYVKPRRGQLMKYAKLEALHAAEAMEIRKHSDTPGNKNVGTPSKNPEAAMKRHSVTKSPKWKPFMKAGKMLNGVSLVFVPLDAYHIAEEVFTRKTEVFTEGRPTDGHGRYVLHRIGHGRVVKVYDDGTTSNIFDDPQTVRLLIKASEKDAKRRFEEFKKECPTGLCA